MSNNRVQARRDSKGGAPDALLSSTSNAPLAPGNAKSLIDVRIDKPGVSRVVLYIALIGFFAAVVLSLIYVSVRQGLFGAAAPAARGVCTGTVAAVSLFIAQRVGQKRMERRIADLIGRDVEGEIASLAQAVAHQKEGLTRKPRVSELVHGLALAGRVGETIRLQWSGAPEPIEPLTVTFEPRSLDEADAAFEELEAASASVEQEDRDAHSRPPPTHRDDVLAVRRIRRNLALKGGWIAAGILAVFFLKAIWESYPHRTVTWGVFFWGGLLALTLYGPVSGGFFGARQWLLVPGGLVVRKARRGGLTSSVHLFERRTSVLCVHQVRRRVWIVTAADADAYETTVGTKKEVDFLLRAWLSPLPPPSAEQLSDLT